MMLYILAYCELLIFLMVVLEVFGCNKTLHIYVCKPLCVDGVLVSGVDLGLLLLAVALCTTIGGGVFHLH